MLGWTFNPKSISCLWKAPLGMLCILCSAQIPLNQLEKAGQDMYLAKTWPSVKMAFLAHGSSGCTSCPWEIRSGQCWDCQLDGKVFILFGTWLLIWMYIYVCSGGLHLWITGLEGMFLVAASIFISCSSQERGDWSVSLDLFFFPAWMNFILGQVSAPE